MLKIINYSFPKTSLACVGEARAIQDLDHYFSLHNVPNSSINMDVFLGRIITNKVYARFEGKTLGEKLNIILRGYNRRLKANGLYMSYHEFVEAAVIIMPDKARTVFHLSEQEIEYIGKHSIWNKRFAK